MDVEHSGILFPRLWMDGLVYFAIGLFLDLQSINICILKPRRSCKPKHFNDLLRIQKWIQYLKALDGNAAISCKLL